MATLNLSPDSRPILDTARLERTPDLYVWEPARAGFPVRQDVDLLSLPERALAYRSMALEAMESAETAHDPEVRKSLHMLAGSWRALALQAEEIIRAQKA